MTTAKNKNVTISNGGKVIQNPLYYRQLQPMLWTAHQVDWSLLHEVKYQRQTNRQTGKQTGRLRRQKQEEKDRNMEFVTASAQKKENRKREINPPTPGYIPRKKEEKRKNIYPRFFFSFKGSDPVANSLSHASFILQGCEVVRAHLLQVDSLLVGVHLGFE